VSTILPGRFGLGFNNQTGTPISIGPGTCNNSTGGGTPYDCGWPINAFNLPSNQIGLSVYYRSDYLDNFDADMTPILTAPNTVATSIDTESLDDAFAISYIQTSQTGGFDLVQHTVAPADLQAAAMQEGLQSRVITAVSYNAEQVEYFSYGWQGDTATIYETKVETATFDTVGSAASDLAASGYILTAVGGNIDDGFLLIGTRVRGDTLPRPLLVVAQGQQNSELWEAGYAIVGCLIDMDGNETFIGEK
jgi:hypothetical protein